jgi:putative transposase
MGGRTVRPRLGRREAGLLGGLRRNLDRLVAYLRFPRQHWKRIRHSNLIERTFGETRRRVKVIGRLPGEQSCLSLVWAVLDRASNGWRGLTMTPPPCAACRTCAGRSSACRDMPTSNQHPRMSLPRRNIMPRSEPASGAVYTAPETPPVTRP